MISAIVKFLKDNVINFIVIGISAAMLYFGVAFFNERIALENREFPKGGIQNHLLWSVKGECFFAKPTYTDTVYLVAVPDCNKDK